MTIPGDAEIRERLRAILATREFQSPVDPSWVVAFKKAIYAVATFLSSLGPIARWAILIGSFALLCGFLYHVVRTLRRLVREGPHVLRGMEATASLPVPTCEELLATARRLKSAGELRQAARALQEAWLLLECRRQAVRWRPTVADWEWIIELGRPAGLVEFTNATQRIAFGTDNSLRAVEDCEGILAAELARNLP